MVRAWATCSGTRCRPPITTWASYGRCRTGTSFALQNVAGVSEVASFGGFQKQYQVSINPHKLLYYDIPLTKVISAINRNNRDVGGSLFEMNRAGYLVKGLGYIKSVEDIQNISLGQYKSVPVRIQ